MSTATVDVLLRFRTDNSALARSQAKLGQLNRTLGRFGTGALLSGIAAATAAFGVLSRSAITFGSTLTDQREQTGLSVRDLQIFGGAMKDAGSDSATFVRGIVAQTTAIQQARQGMATYTRAFADLGLDYDRLAAMSPSVQFETIAGAVVNAEDQQKAFNAATQIYGRRIAPQLLEVMGRMSKDGFQQMSKDIEEAYGVLETKTAESLDRAADAIERWKNRATVAVGEALGMFEDTSKIRAFGFYMQAEAARFGGGMIDTLINVATLIPRIIGAGIFAVVEYFDAGLRKTVATVATKLLEAAWTFAQNLPLGIGEAVADKIAPALIAAKTAADSISVPQLENFVGRWSDLTDASATNIGYRMGEAAARAWENKAAAAIGAGGTSTLTGEPIQNDTVTLGSAARPDFGNPESGRAAEENNGKSPVDAEVVKEASAETEVLNAALWSTSSAITGLINGTTTWGNAFKSVGRAIVSTLVQIGVQAAANYIRGKFFNKEEQKQSKEKIVSNVVEGGTKSIAQLGPIWGVVAFAAAIAGILALMGQFRETGGGVRRGAPYIVGERRPEVFIPNQDGRIVSSTNGFGGFGNAGGSAQAPVVNVMTFDSEAKARRFASQRGLDARFIDLARRNRWALA